MPTRSYYNKLPNTGGAPVAAPNFLPTAKPAALLTPQITQIAITPPAVATSQLFTGLSANKPAQSLTNIIAGTTQMLRYPALNLGTVVSDIPFTEIPGPVVSVTSISLTRRIGVVSVGSNSGWVNPNNLIGLHDGNSMTVAGSATAAVTASNVSTYTAKSDTTPVITSANLYLYYSSAVTVGFTSTLVFFAQYNGGSLNTILNTTTADSHLTSPVVVPVPAQYLDWASINSLLIEINASIPLGAVATTFTVDAVELQVTATI